MKPPSGYPQGVGDRTRGRKIKVGTEIPTEDSSKRVSQEKKPKEGSRNSKEVAKEERTRLRTWGRKKVKRKGLSEA